MALFIVRMYKKGDMRMFNCKNNHKLQVVENRNTFINDLPNIKIKVLGVGGGGCNAINRMIEYGLKNIEFWAFNTDVQILELNQAPNKLQIGKSLTGGRGAGGIIEVGEKAAIEMQTEIIKTIQGADLLFITAGLGGGTGTGAIPIIAECARNLGILTIAIVTEPFRWEGNRRKREAQKGLAKLEPLVDSIIVVSNDELINITTKNTTIRSAFTIADEILLKSIQGIGDILTSPGVINIDFSDVKNVIKNAGNALIGIGLGEGKDGCIEAANLAMTSKLLKYPIKNAKGLIINICGDSKMTLGQVIDAMSVINEYVNPDTNIVMGTSIDESLHNKAVVTVIATGISEKSDEKENLML